MSSPWTILITDDCAEDREIYREYLSIDPHQSYEFLEAGSAEFALTLCQQNRCDAILLDFYLPDMTGLEFLDELKLSRLQAATPIIMLTGQGDETIAVQAMKQGVQDYLAKHHLQPQVLQFAVRSVVQQSRLRSRLHHTQDHQRLIATTALHIRESLDLEQILNTAVTAVQRLLQCDRVAVYQLTQDFGGAVHQLRLTGCEIIPNQPDQNRVCTWQYEGEPYQGHIRAISPCEVTQLSSLETLAQTANLVEPIVFHSAGEPLLWGLLVAERTDSPWHSDAVKVLQELAVQLAIAIQQSELLSQTQTALSKEKDLNAFKSQIIATVSHEYRTPLATILAAATTLKQHHDDLEVDRRNRFLQLIEDKARHMGKLVDDLLMVHQCELSKTSFNPIPIELLQFVSDIVEEQRLTITKQHDLSLRISGSNKNFWGDRGLLRLILINLLSNAIKYSPDGGPIEVQLIGTETHVQFGVRDQGIGIPIADQVNLFQSFSRASNVGTLPGTGLGLAIAKACVELHQGEMTLISEEGSGTEVTVCLPKRPLV